MQTIFSLVNKLFNKREIHLDRLREYLRVSRKERDLATELDRDLYLVRSRSLESFLSRRRTVRSLDIVLHFRRNNRVRSFDN